MAPAMSMRCMTVPPRMNPSGFASLGSTTCTISVADSAARLGVTSKLWLLEVVADPDREPRLAERGAAAGGRKQHVLPVLVEERPPRPVEVDREPEREGFETHPVGGAAIPQPEAAHGLVRDDGNGKACDWIRQISACRVGLVAHDCRVRLG